MGKTSETCTFKKEKSQVLQNVHRTQDAVMHHQAKTIYFHELWKSFLMKTGLIVSLFNIAMCAQLWFSYSVTNPISYFFEVLSMICVVPTSLFVVRHVSSVRCFKIAFTLSLLQIFWWGYCLFHRKAGHGLSVDLIPEQWPIGATFFLVCWISDRFMVSSNGEAKDAVSAFQEIGKKLQ